ncbi:hypothetical protein [Bacteroides acidifaciens]
MLNETGGREVLINDKFLRTRRIYLRLYRHVPTD